MLPLLDPRDIIDATERYYLIREGYILSNRRTKTIAEARAVAMYISRKFTVFSLFELGEYYFNRDHSTILIACKKVEKILKQGVPTECSRVVDKLIKEFKTKVENESIRKSITEIHQKWRTLLDLSRKNKDVADILKDLELLQGMEPLVARKRDSRGVFI